MKPILQDSNERLQVTVVYRQPTVVQLHVGITTKLCAEGEMINGLDVRHLLA